jgi:hypothetical protein
MPKFLLTLLFIACLLPNTYAQAQTNRLEPTGNVGVGTLTPSEKLTIYNGNLLFRRQFGTGPDYDWFTIGSQEQIEKPITGVHVELLGSNINPATDADGKPTSRNNQPTAAYRQAWALTFGSGEYHNNFSIWGGRYASANTPLVPMFNITSGGNVSIGTTDPGQYKLAVEGCIGARRVKVTQQPWADFVFEPSYVLPSIEAVEAHIREKGHLQGIPSASEIARDGLDIGDMQQKQMQKIEELTLYVIDLHKKLSQQQKIIEEQQQALRVLSRVSAEPKE